MFSNHQRFNGLSVRIFSIHSPKFSKEWLHFDHDVLVRASILLPISMNMLNDSSEVFFTHMGYVSFSFFQSELILEALDGLFCRNRLYVRHRLRLAKQGVVIPSRWKRRNV